MRLLQEQKCQRFFYFWSIWIHDSFFCSLNFYFVAFLVVYILITLILWSFTNVELQTCASTLSHLRTLCSPIGQKGKLLIVVHDFVLLRVHSCLVLFFFYASPCCYFVNLLHIINCFHFIFLKKFSFTRYTSKT